MISTSVPMMTALEDLRLVFVTGKGGIGKSLISAALAMRMSELGRKVLLVQQAASDHLGPLVGVKGVSHEVLAVHPHLGVANFTPGGNFKDFVTKHLKRGGVFESLAGSRLVHGFFTTIPGFGELMLLGRLYHSLQLASDRPDVIIVDSYASGHFLNLMTTPDAVIESGLAGPIVEETKNVRRFLQEQRNAGVVFVGVPEELVVSEMLDFLPKFQQLSPAAVRLVVFNRVLSMADESGIEGPTTPATQFLAQRVLAQKSAMQTWWERSRDTGLARIAVSCVPELGFIDDPLSKTVIAQLLDTKRST